MADYCSSAPGHPLHGPYHATQYGFPIADDAELFQRMTLEINQAGLSWLTMLAKREAFIAAFRGFDPKVVAQFDETDRARLLADAGIVRNRLKVDAVIENARRIVTIQQEWGSFANWIAAHHPREHAEWVKLFRKTFKFMGGEIVGEFLMSIGYLPGAHREDCPVYAAVVAKQPPWMGTEQKN